MMKKDFEEHYGLNPGTLEEFLECAVETEETMSEAGDIHPASIAPSIANSNGFPIGTPASCMSPQALSPKTDRAIEESLRLQIKHLQEKLQNQQKQAESTTPIRTPMTGDSKAFLSGPYSEILEGCNGTSEFPQDWEEGTMEYKTFLYNEEEEFANLTKRPIEDPAVERKEFTRYKTSKKDLAGSAHLALSYLRTIGDDISLAPSCVGEEARNIIEDEISSGKIKKLVKCKVSRAMVGAMCQHLSGAKKQYLKKRSGQKNQTVSLQKETVQ